MLWLALLAAALAPAPLYRDPVHDGAADPAVVWNPARKAWWMFYTNRRANVEELEGVTWVHGTRIGIAESADGGASWKYAGTARIEYGGEGTTHWAPEIVAREGVWHMYLSIVPGVFRDWNAPRSIVHLSSRDLREWKYESTIELGSDRVIDASVVRLPDGGWRMWYKDERARDGSLRYADSPDLRRWTPKGNAIPGVSGEGAKVFHWQGRYWMVVDVWKGLAVFESSDCLNWKRQLRDIMAEPGVRPTDRSKGGHADVVVNGGRAYLFYFVHQAGADAEGRAANWSRRSVIQAAELEYRDGAAECDRNRPLRIELKPPR